MSAPPGSITYDDAKLRRDAAHALSTPLGALLLQAELIEHLLRHNDIGRARTASATLMSDCESFGRLLRDTFSTMADIAEAGTEPSDPRACLEEVLEELGEETVAIAYEGDAQLIAVPRKAVEALMRRVAMETSNLQPRGARITARSDGDMLQMSVEASGERRPMLTDTPFHGVQGLNLWTAREIAVRYGGDLRLGGEGNVVLQFSLPLATATATYGASVV